MTMQSIFGLPHLGTPISALPFSGSNSDPWSGYVDFLDIEERMIFSEENPVSDFEAAWARLQERQRSYNVGIAEAAKLAPPPPVVTPPAWDIGYPGGRPWRHHTPPGWGSGRPSWHGYGYGHGGGHRC